MHRRIFRTYSLSLSSAFGSPAGEAEVEFAPSVTQSLFLLNEKLLKNWLTPQKNNLIDRLSKEPSDPKIAEELYLTILSRFPEKEETALVTEYLHTHGKRRSKALEEVAWALVTSSEFRLNH